MAENLPDTNVGNIEYISRQDAFDAVEARITELMTHPEFRRKHLDIDLSGVIRNISAIKPADVVQVCRCEDCRYYGSRRWCELHSSVFDDNAFCSYGERSEE